MDARMLGHLAKSAKRGLSLFERKDLAAPVKPHIQSFNDSKFDRIGWKPRKA